MADAPPAITSSSGLPGGSAFPPSGGNDRWFIAPYDELSEDDVIELQRENHRLRVALGEATVKCARRWCRKRLRLNPIFGGEGKQWCSEEHRDGRSVQRIDLSWSRMNEYRDFRPRRDVGMHWVEYRWAWMRLVVTR